MRGNLERLEIEIGAATGADTDLDAGIHAAVYGGSSGKAPAYTASVDACLTLIQKGLPEWHWHIGYGPRGILPYAVMTAGAAAGDAKAEMTAPTVPLALLGAFVKALRIAHTAGAR